MQHPPIVADLARPVRTIKTPFLSPDDNCSHYSVICDKMKDEHRLIEGIRGRRKGSARASHLIEQAIAANEVHIRKLQIRLGSYEEMCADKLLDKETFSRRKEDITKSIAKLCKEQSEWRQR